MEMATETEGKIQLPKFFTNSFINGNANSFYHNILNICSLLRNDSFRLSCQAKPEIKHFPRHTK